MPAEVLGPFHSYIKLCVRRRVFLIVISPKLIVSRIRSQTYTLLNSFELTNSFMLEKLRLKRTEFDGLTKQELIKDLQEEH